MAAQEDQALQGLFDSNKPPSSQQCSIAQAAIESFDQALTAVNEDIADRESQLAATVKQPLGDLEHQLVELQARKKVIEEKKQKYMDVISARRRIPTEIVGAFIEEAYSPSPLSFKGEPPFLPFMLVSRAWYNIVCGITRIWAAWYLDLRSTSEEADIRRVVEKAARWYSRAGSVPITLSLSLSSSNPNNQIFIDYLHSIANNFEALDIEIVMMTSSNVGLLRQVFQDPDSKHITFPIMKKLHLSIRFRRDARREVQLSDIFSHPCEQFQALEDFAIRSNGTIAKFDMPWDSLTTLRLGPFSVMRKFQGMTYCSILGSCQNLRSLHVGIEPQDGTDARVFIRELPSNGVKVTLPHLTQLSVEYGFFCEIACATLFESLVLPSLQSLTWKYVGNSTGMYWDFSDVLPEMIARSNTSNTIKSISIDLKEALSDSLETLVGVFREAPGLEVLELSGDEIDIGLMEILPGALKELTLQLAVDTVRVAFARYLDDNACQRVRVRIVEGKGRQ
ncbi:hypothetical protein EST38_g10236 [Candolleomyces aberdarensis]|uniref:F-box domain-containing protein n=1 Tax=Candolleomyces aberdarensis TaxID=2316362 RepID=A0A4Q2D9L3_9AGAR|nr:hypothetical protein EST38_g10236 [Candolleomyces aberdarensis]